MGVESEGACSADSRSSALLDPATKARPPDSNAQVQENPPCATQGGTPWCRWCHHVNGTTESCLAGRHSGLDQALVGQCRAHLPCRTLP